MKNYKDLIQQFKPDTERVLDSFKNELQKIRTGRANPTLVEDILVDCYGSKVSLNQVAAISCPGPRQILIQPWDKSVVTSIEKALRQADVGVSPVADKEVIRINLPPLTEEFRKNLIIQIGRKKEETRETLRKWRDHALKEVQKAFHEKEISEDDKFKAKEEFQELVDGLNEKIDEIVEIKEKEIME